MDQQTPPARSGGCLKWGCAGCLGLVLIPLLALVAAWFYLSRWDTRDSAWNHLPPSTVVAMEIRDIRGMLQHSLQDPALISLIGRYSAKLGAELSTLPNLDYVPSRDGREWIELYRYFGFLHTAIAPNLALVGMTDTDDLFILAQLPAWTGWTLNAEDEGKIFLWEQDDYIFHLDGWIGIAESSEVLKQVLDSWDANSLPLGPPQIDPGPSILLAGKMFDKTPDQAKPPAEQADTPLMLGNPFAAAEPEPAFGSIFRFSLRPQGKGWHGAGFASWEMPLEQAESLIRNPPLIDSTAWPDIPALDKPVQMAGHVNAEALVDLFERLEHRLPELAEKLVYSMRGDVVLTVDAPLFEDPYILPAPVCTLGWAAQSKNAAENIADELAKTVAAIHTRGPNQTEMASAFLAEAIRVDFLNQADGHGMAVLLPPELANAANPTWFVQPDTEPPSLWLATDPSGLAWRGQMQSALGKTEESTAAIRAACGWKMTEKFRTGLYAMVQDRISLLPPDTLPWGEQAAMANELVKAALTLYPQGELRMAIGTDKNQIQLLVDVPFGAE